MALIKINKSQARKLYAKGVEIKLLPCKVGLHSIWISPCPLKFDPDQPDPYSGTPDQVFEKSVNEYLYYNCCAELGAYPHYYTEQTPALN